MGILPMRFRAILALSGRCICCCVEEEKEEETEETKEMGKMPMPHKTWLKPGKS
jgi:hypothetical protein